MKRRNSLRYRGHDYPSPGGYFVTIRLQDAWHLLGAVAHGVMRLTPAGRMVHDTLDNLSAFIPSIAMDTFIVMPDHVHALVFLGVEPAAESPSLGNLVGRFKSITTSRYIVGVKERGWPRFTNHLWQRDYYDHIIRSDRGVEKIREYIQGNPGRWQETLVSRQKYS